MLARSELSIFLINQTIARCVLTIKQTINYGNYQVFTVCGTNTNILLLNSCWLNLRSKTYPDSNCFAFLMYAQDTSLLLSKTFVVLGEAEDRFVHSVPWSLGSPHSPLSHKIYDTRCQNSTNECLLSFCLLFLNENIFKIWSKKIWVFQASPSFPLFFNCVVPPLWQDVRYKMSPRDVKTP